jgi:hypothetical protein
MEEAAMCWFSAEHAKNIEQAKVGQRLAIKNMNWHAKWVVREEELESPRPCPVCLADQTRVLFRFSENQQTSLHFGSETEAVFKMIKQPKLDIFEFPDGRQMNLSELPAGVVLDVLVVPGQEQLSDILDKESAAQEEEETEREPFLARLLARF